MCMFPYWDRAWQNTERPPALSSVLSLLKEENGEQVGCYDIQYTFE